MGNLLNLPIVTCLTKIQPLISYKSSVFGRKLSIFAF